MSQIDKKPPRRRAKTTVTDDGVRTTGPGICQGSFHPHDQEPDPALKKNSPEDSDSTPASDGGGDVSPAPTEFVADTSMRPINTADIMPTKGRLWPWVPQYPRKLYGSGNSVVLSIPPQLVDILGLDIGVALTLSPLPPGVLLLSHPDVWPLAKRLIIDPIVQIYGEVPSEDIQYVRMAYEITKPS